jgi:hypothetical protein
MIGYLRFSITSLLPYCIATNSLLLRCRGLPYWLDTTRRPNVSPPPSAPAPAGQAGDDDVEESDDAVAAIS